MSDELTLPGLESAIAEMEKKALTDKEVKGLPTYTAERVANYEPERYELAARLLFAENMSRRTICRWLHMSPNTLSAIEVRELRLHPERVEELKRESAAEIEQLKRVGREALRARFFDNDAVKKIPAKEIALILKLLDEMSERNRPEAPQNPNRNTENNDYIDAMSSWQEDGFGREKNSAPETVDANNDAAPKNERNAAIEPAEAVNEPGKEVAKRDSCTIQQN